MAGSHVQASRALDSTTTYPGFHCEETNTNEWKLSNCLASCQNILCWSYTDVVLMVSSF